MKGVGHMNSQSRYYGSVIVGFVPLFVIALVILAFARYFWVNAANKYFNDLITVYINEKDEYTLQNHEELYNKLLESGLFIKVHRWNRESFIKDQGLYKDMIVTRDQRQRREEKGEQSVIDSVINL
jgi:hypothetical protein